MQPTAFFIISILLAACGASSHDVIVSHGASAATEDAQIHQIAVLPHKSEVNTWKSARQWQQKACTELSATETVEGLWKIQYHCAEDDTKTFGPVSFELAPLALTIAGSIKQAGEKIAKSKRGCLMTDVKIIDNATHKNPHVIIGSRCQTTSKKTNAQLATDYSAYSEPTRIQAKTFYTLQQGMAMALSRVKFDEDKDVISSIEIKDGGFLTSPYAELEIRFKK